MTELKDYAHLYLGCKAILTNEDAEQKKFVLNAFNLNYYRDYLSEIKLILRPLESMTKEEGEFMYSGMIGTFDIEVPIKDPVDETATIPISPYQIHYLLSKGFDIFGLHKAGLAVYENEKGELV